MASKKKVEETEEIVEETPQEEEINYKEDIQDKSLKEIASEKPEEKIEEKKEEDSKGSESATVKEEVKEEVKIDPEKIKEEAKKEVKDELADFLKGTKEEENKDEYDQFVDKYTKEHGHTPDWKMVASFIKEQAKGELKAEQEAQIKSQQEQQTQAKNKEETELEAFNKELDEELNEEYKSGNLPKIKNPNDPNDYGVIARKSLFETMAQVNIKRVESGQSPIRSISRIRANYWKAPNRQPAGENAAVIENRSSATSANDGEEYSYKDIHKTGWRGFFKR